MHADSKLMLYRSEGIMKTLLTQIYFHRFLQDLYHFLFLLLDETVSKGKRRRNEMGICGKEKKSKGRVQLSRLESANVDDGDDEIYRERIRFVNFVCLRRTDLHIQGFMFQHFVVLLCHFQHHIFLF